MKSHFTLFSVLCIFILSSVGLNAQPLVNTSFETTDNYAAGTIHSKNKWTVTTGNGEIVTQADYILEGTQALKLWANNTALQVDRTDFVSNAIALSGDVYLDFRIKFKTLPTANFAITGYDLGTNTSRSFMVEFQPSSKLKIYDGSAGWATQPAFTVDTWNRITVKIDNGGAKYQLAVNGEVQNKTFAFREIKNGATTFDYHSIRFTMASGTCDVAFDNLYIGSTPLSDIAFQSSSTDRTITLTQPTYGNISLSPVKATYQINDQVTASITVPDHYLFTGWTGDLAGTANPLTFTVDKNYSIGATVSIDPANPPAQSTITVTQPVGGTITLVPQQTVYYNGASVSAQLSIQSGYQFNGWSGGLSGTTNPASFVVNGDLAIGANVSAIQVSSTLRTVSTAAQFKEALAAMNPGDTVLVLDGTYNLGGLKVTQGGSALKPIVVKSKNLYGAKITGPTYFNLSYQSYVTYEGFDINVDAGSTIFKMEGCSHVRITRNWLRMPTTSDTQTSKWITIGDLWSSEICNSHENRFDHNLFDGKFDQGAWLVIDGSHGTVPAISQHDRIDHNIFRNNTPRVTNEKETIRIGVSDLCKLDAYTVVENNLFEDCDGDPEIVSLKSCKDTVRYNTFRRCVGTVSLRQGNNSVVEGNFFFGENKTTLFGTETIGCGGVRVYGMNHKIINNYFEGLTGDKWDAACTITNGDVTNTSTSNSSHFLAENTVFAFNTLVNNKSNIEVGFNNNGAYGLAPKNNIIANNLVIGTVNPFIKYYSTASLAGLGFQNNLMYPTESATLGLTGTTDAQIRIVDPQLTPSSCRASGQNCDQRTKHEVYKLTSGSPAINASIGYESVTRDFEGQPAIGIRDIGADEYSGAVQIINAPLDEQMVGPTAPENIVYEITTATGVAETFATGLTVSPNPFSGETRLSIPVEVAGKISISLYNATGQQIQSTKRQAPAGNFEYQITTSAKGILFCVVEVGNKRHTIKLITE